LKRLREITIWATLIATGLLVVLSGAGAFSGTEESRKLFNSGPLALFWVLFSALFVLGLVVFKRLRHSPGLLAIHAGSLLVLVGSLWASQGGHDLAKRLFNSRKIRAGYMRIQEGHSDSIVRDGDGQQLGRLPFSVGLEDFWLEYYDTWILAIDVPPVDDTHERPQTIIPWAGKTGTELDVPFTGAKLTVLQYIDTAKAVFREIDDPPLEISDSGSEKIVVPVEIGKKIPLPSGRGVLTIDRKFTHLVVQGRKAVNVDGSNANPAVQVRIEKPDGTEVYDYAWSRPVRMPGRGLEGLNLRYVLREFVGVETDPTSTVPAMEVLLTYEGKSLREWLLARDPMIPVQLPLASLLGSRPHVDAHGHRHAGPRLLMGPPRGAIRDFKSRLVVLEEGKQIIEKVIEVNDPLHYEGYHFYQHGYDARAGRFTDLRVTSDSGLTFVYMGFFLLCAGTFWLFWVQPAWAYFRKPRDHGA